MSGQRTSVVERVNEQVSIVVACRLAGLSVPDDLASGRSVKLPCPFGAVYHKDGGIDPSFRIYPDSNSGYCFRCSQYFTPVGMAAMVWDTSQRQAALRLMELVGLTPTTMAQRWQAAQVDHRPVNTGALADALKMYCARMCGDWDEMQFDPEVSAVFAKCLGLLDGVSSDQGAREWLARCKSAMGWAFCLRASSTGLP